MKRISPKQSRRNSARRERKVNARQAQAGRWKPQPEPMFTSRKIHYEIGANIDAMNFGGMGGARVNRRVNVSGGFLPLVG